MVTYTSRTSNLSGNRCGSLCGLVVFLVIGVVIIQQTIYYIIKLRKHCVELNFNIQEIKIQDLGPEYCAVEGFNVSASIYAGALLLVKKSSPTRGCRASSSPIGVQVYLCLLIVVPFLPVK